MQRKRHQMDGELIFDMLRLSGKSSRIHRGPFCRAPAWESTFRSLAIRSRGASSLRSPRWNRNQFQHANPDARMPVNAAPLLPSDKSLIREGKHREKGKC